jgi:hypothetical protein
MDLLTIHTERELDVTILLLVIVAFWIGSKIWTRIYQRRQKRILLSGIESEATVIGFGHTGRFVNNAPQLKVQIQIRPQKGRNFVTEIKQAVSWADFNLLRAGSRIIVKYDPIYPKQAVLMRTAQ